MNHSRSVLRLIRDLPSGLLLLAAAFGWCQPASANPPQAVPVPLLVDDSATGANDGSSWTDAFPSLDTALGLVVPGQEIWVAEGTYIPADHVNGFRVPADVKLYGGFVGTETYVSGRLGTAAHTILEGDYGSGFAEHVVTVTTVAPAAGSPGATIDGFQIQHGLAWNYPNQNGGGIWCRNTDLDLVGCIVLDNTAYNGGGLYFEESATGAGGYNVLHVKTTEFRSNYADYKGGGIFGKELRGFVVSSQFLTNEALEQGGGVYLETMGSTLADEVNFTGCVFWGNWVNDTSSPGSGPYLGGGAKLDIGANARFVNCTFSDNYMNDCLDGQAVFVDPAALGKLYNTILAFNNNSACSNAPIGGTAATVVEYCDTWWGSGSTAWPTGSGNLAADPLFRRHSVGFLTLKTVPSGSGSSPCVDAANYSELGPDVLDLDRDGDTTEVLPIDLLSATRFVDRWESDTGAPTGSAYLDMGAYEHP